MMDEDECLVCEFPNEENSVQVGYRRWLDTEYTDKEMDQLISEKMVITIKWPENVDVMPPPAMKKKKVENWLKWPTRIIAKGKWTAMCDIIRSMEKGILLPTQIEKESRKLRAAKTHENTTSETNKHKKDDEVKYQKSLKKLTKQQQTVSKRSLEKTILESCNLLFSPSSSKKVAPHPASLDDSSDDENENMKKIKKADLVEKLTVVMEENRRLKCDNARLRALRCMDEGLPEMMGSFKILKNEMKLLSTKATTSKNNAATISKNNAATISKNNVSTTLKNDVLKNNAATAISKNDVATTSKNTVSTTLKNDVSKNSAEIDPQGDEKHADKPITPSSNVINNGTPTKAAFKSYSPDDTFENHVAKLTPSSNEINNENLISTDDQIEKSEIANNYSTSSSGANEQLDTTVHEDSLQRKLSIIASTISEHNFSKTVANGLRCLFTEEELALGSLCGGLANCDKGREGSVPKQKLDSVKIEALKKALRDRIIPGDKLKVEKVFIQEFKKAVINKCGTEKKALLKKNTQQ